MAAPANQSPLEMQIILMICGGLVLVVGVWPLARGLAASAPVRAVAIIAFLFLVLGVNNVLEARLFTHLLDGGVTPSVVYYAVQAIVVGVALGTLFGAPGKGAGLAPRTWRAWTGKALTAWLAWPVIYLSFGMCIAPIVTPYYNAGIAGLRIPPLPAIVELQLFRSVIFLAVSSLLMALWKGSRRGLWLTLGLTHATVVGLHELVAATFLPMVLRITHGIEITADSFVYAGLLVWLFSAATTAAAVERVEEPQVTAV